MLSDTREIGFCLGKRHARFEAAEWRNPVRGANFDGTELKQWPDFVIVTATEVEVRGHNTDDGMRLAVKQHGSPDYEGVTAKLRLPESKTENNFTRLAWSFAGWAEVTPRRACTPRAAKNSPVAGVPRTRCGSPAPV